MSPYVDISGRDVCLTWEAGNGKSLYYAWNTEVNNWMPFDLNLPVVPIPDVLGTVMMRAYKDNIGRDIALVWDTKTGKSLYYFWNADIQNWDIFAKNLPPVTIPNPEGNVMMFPYVDNVGKDVCLVWDVKTGHSLFWYWSGEKNDWETYPINLPQKPLLNASQNVMMHCYIDNIGRDVCLVWNTKTGQSKFYTWNYELNDWSSFEINLPAKPVPGANGEIMMHPYKDRNGRDICLVWEQMTGKSLYYFWSASANDWTAFDLNLPENPVPNAIGRIMMRPYINNIGREICLVWDVTSGKSVYYAWSISEKIWKPSEINLPEIPTQK